MQAVQIMIRRRVLLLKPPSFQYQGVWLIFVIIAF